MHQSGLRTVCFLGILEYTFVRLLFILPIQTKQIEQVTRGRVKCNALSSHLAISRLSMFKMNLTFDSFGGEVVVMEKWVVWAALKEVFILSLSWFVGF